MRKNTAGIGKIRTVHEFSSVHRLDDVRISKMRNALNEAGFEVEQTGRAPRLTGPAYAGTHVLPESRYRLVRMLRGWAALMRAAGPDVLVHFHDPELLPAACWLVLQGRRMVYDVHEDYAGQIADKEWIPPLVRNAVGRWVSALEQLFIRSGGFAIAATPFIGEKFPPGRCSVVRNLPEPLPDMPGKDQIRDLDVTFVGEVRPVRGARVLMETAGMLVRERGLRITVAGPLAGMTPGDEAAFRRAPGIDYLGPVGYAEARALMRRSKTGMVPFLPARNNVNSLPTKVLEYFLEGTPVVLSDFPAWRSEYGPSGGAVFATPGDPEAFAQALTGLLDNVTTGRTAVQLQGWVMDGRTWLSGKKDFLKAVERAAG